MCLSVSFYSKWEYFIDRLLNVGITIMVCRRDLNSVDALAAKGVLVLVITDLEQTGCLLCRYSYHSYSPMVLYLVLYLLCRNNPMVA